MFTVEERDRARDHVLGLARRDERIVAGAAVGALAAGIGDRWSDLDLTFGLADGVGADEVLRDWTAALAGDLGAVHLFDLPFLSTIYRVFLLPGNLQLDVSFTPTREFGPLGPRFTLLFGEAVERERPPRPTVDRLFGLGAHHAVRARICIERGRPWQAAYWVGSVRDEALALACRQRGLEASYGRGFDELPAEVLGRASAALVTSLAGDELIRALGAAIDLLLDEAGAAGARLSAQLRELASPKLSTEAGS